MGPNSKWLPKSKMAAWKLNNHIFGPNWHRSAIFWCKYGFLRSRNSTMLLFFMSCGPNSKWPPKSKMAAWKLNNHISGPNWHISAIFWCTYGFLKSRNTIILSFFMSYGPNSKWPLKSKMATRKLNCHISALKWWRPALFWCKYGFLRSRNPIVLLLFMSNSPNSKWTQNPRCPPENKEMIFLLQIDTYLKFLCVNMGFSGQVLSFMPYIGEEGVRSHKMQRNLQNRAGVCLIWVTFGITNQYIVGY